VPPPRLGTWPYRYETTEAKAATSESCCSNDPIAPRESTSTKARPKDLPVGDQLRGTFDASDPTIRGILPKRELFFPPPYPEYPSLTTKQTGFMRQSCHIGEAAGKAGQQINFNVGGEGPRLL